MIPFGGWEMPVQYKGIIAEHLHTRKFAGLFDVSHMGEIWLEGDQKDLLLELERLTCNQVAGLQENQVQYNAIVNEAGGLVDDITLYKISDRSYMICSNASNFEAVYEHFLKYRTTKIEVRNESKDWHQIALQGPISNDIFSDFLGINLDSIGYYRFANLAWQGSTLLVSRTGYTGEDGFEIYSDLDSGVRLWESLLKNYPDHLCPVGLGARDTLRLEAKYPLYGHELTAERSPVESGIGWIVKEKSVPYLGYERIIRDKKNGPKFKTVGIELQEPGVLRENYNVYADGDSSDSAPDSTARIGFTTSGTHSPSLKKSIGMALIQSEFALNHKEIYVEIRGQLKKAILNTGKFIEGSVRKNK